MVDATTRRNRQPVYRGLYVEPGEAQPSLDELLHGEAEDEDTVSLAYFADEQ